MYAPYAAAVRAVGAASAATQPRAITATVIAYPAPKAYGFSVAARPAGPPRKPAAPVSSPAEFSPGTRDIRVEIGIQFTQADDSTEEEQFALSKPLLRRLSAENAVKAVDEAAKCALPKPLPRRPSATMDKPPGLPMPKPAVGALKAKLEAEGGAAARAMPPVEELE